jgi:hypothetical protein
VTESPQWYRFDLLFLFVGYFECEHCHRPIMREARFATEEEWRDHVFEIRCCCNWGPVQRPGSSTIHQLVVRWNQKIRSLENSDGT